MNINYAQLIASGAMDVLLAEMRAAGIKNQTIPAFEDAVASGSLTAAEKRMLAMNLVDPHWLTRAARQSPNIL